MTPAPGERRWSTRHPLLRNRARVARQPGGLEIEKQLLAGRFDVILSSWTPSRKTPAEVTASAPFYSWGLVIVVRQDSKLRTFSDLSEPPSSASMPIPRWNRPWARRKDAALLAKVQAAVRTLLSSPDMARIKAKWEAFGKP